MGNAIKPAKSVSFPEPRRENRADVGLRRDLDPLVRIFHGCQNAGAGPELSLRLRQMPSARPRAPRVGRLP
jgi:hypothetical protein